MIFAEEDFAGAQCSEFSDRRELSPSSLDEAERHAMSRTNDYHALVVDAVIEVVRIAIEAAFALAFRRHHDDRVASFGDQAFIRKGVRPSTVAILLSINPERMREERLQKITCEKKAEWIDGCPCVGDDGYAVAKPRQGDEDGNRR